MKMKFTAKTIPCYYGGKCNLALSGPGEFEINDEKEAERLMADFPDDFKPANAVKAIFKSANKMMSGKNK